MASARAKRAIIAAPKRMNWTSPSRGRCSWVRGSVVPGWEVQSLISSLGKGKTKSIFAVGIDLAKHVLAVHGIERANCATLVRSSVARDKLVERIGSKFVTPYRLSGKCRTNDAANQQVISEALQRSQMRFVAVNRETLQAQLMVHYARQGIVKERTVTLNRMRGLLAEFGHILAAEVDPVRREAAKLPEALPGHSNRVIGDLLSQIHYLRKMGSRWNRFLPIAWLAGRSGPSSPARHRHQRQSTGLSGWHA